MFTFAERFKNLRETKKISQRKIAKDLKISHSTICLWESGKRRPDIEFLEKLANYFNVSIQELLGTEETKKSNIIDITLTEEQKALIEKITELNLDNFQCKRLNLYIDRMIEDDKKEEETVKMLYNQLHGKIKSIDN